MEIHPIYSNNPKGQASRMVVVNVTLRVKFVLVRAQKKITFENVLKARVCLWS